MDITFSISELIGIDPGAIRLLTTLIASVLFAYPHRLICDKLSPTLQHLFNTGTGIALLYYGFGSTILHVLIDICTVAFLLKFTGGTLFSVLVTWGVVFGHLLWGYYLEYLTGGRQLTNWLLPQCVVTLKLIGLATSLYDARRDKEKDSQVSKGDREFKLESDKVDVLEVLGFCCLFSTSIVGPQISFRRYVNFVNGTLYNKDSTVGNVRYALTRLSLSIVYGVFYLILTHTVPSANYLLTPAFSQENFAMKMLMSAIPYYMLYKRYTIGWLLVESTCALMGLSFNKNGDGSYDWKGCSCVELLRWETQTSAKDFVTSMNISVNNWLIYFIYKKLRFMNSPNLQQLLVTLFVCIWHSLHPGVYIAFLSPVFLNMHIQKLHEFLRVCFREPSTLVRILGKIGYNIFLNIHMGFFFFTFSFPSPNEFLKYWQAVHYFGIYLIIAELSMIPIMNALIKRAKSN